MKNKIAVVTGAASGIGLAISEKLISSGCKVVMADINKEKGEQEAKRIGGNFFYADLSERKYCKDLIGFTVKKFGGIDILVNNAGIQYVSPVEDFPEDKWDFMIRLMLTAPFLLTKYSWNYMKSKKWGRIININSVHGLRASEFKSAYISAKHGLSGLTKTTALEGAKYGITVNSICPAYVRTPLVEKQIDAQAKNHGIPREKVIEEIMLKKAYIKRLIEPSEIGDMVLFLCSENASCITGSMFTIDCGWTAS